MNPDVRAIITEGNPNVLVDTAKQLGEDLSRQLTTSQIRNIFGEVRRIEMDWPNVRSGQILAEEEHKRAQDAYRRVVLLQPKLAYQARRERGRGVQMLQEVLDPCIAEIRKAENDVDRKLYFSRFVDFFEAILAYHKAAGGN